HGEQPPLIMKLACPLTSPHLLAALSPCGESAARGRSQANESLRELHVKLKIRSTETMTLFWFVNNLFSGRDALFVGAHKESGTGKWNRQQLPTWRLPSAKVPLLMSGARGGLGWLLLSWRVRAMQKTNSRRILKSDIASGDNGSN
ncbi:MAG: hypothetical protein Q7S94_02300, partial [Gallionella sp.]|nr:hypothetical protein [Gallionella sp.]